MVEKQLAEDVPCHERLRGKGRGDGREAVAEDVPCHERLRGKGRGDGREAK